MRRSSVETESDQLKFDPLRQAGGDVTGSRDVRVASPRLEGRDHECAILDHLVSQVRGGRSGVLLLRGESGIGKTALLHYLIEAGSDLTLVRCTGAESEMELPYAGLYELCFPLLDGLGSLPEPQQRALSVALGLCC